MNSSIAFFNQVDTADPRAGHRVYRLGSATNPLTILGRITRWGRNSNSARPMFNVYLAQRADGSEIIVFEDEIQTGNG
jgi:hypothetical protein